MGQTPAGEARLRARVRGDVQGVGFRFFVARRANAAGLRGWAANRPDGSVEVLAEGRRADLESLLSDLRRGPPGAQVNEVEAAWERGQGDLRGFSIAG